MISIESIIKTVWREFTTHFKEWMILLAPFILIGAAVNVGLSYLPRYNDPTKFLATIGNNPVSAVIIFTLLTLLSVAIGIAVNVAAMVSAERVLENKPFDVRAAYQNALGRFLPVLWVGILKGITIGIGLILLIVPGIIFAFWYAFAEVITALDGSGGWTAMRRSKEMTRGRIGTLIASLAVPGLLFGVGAWLAQLIASIVLGLIGYALQSATSGVGATILNALVALVATAIGYIALPLGILTLVVVYRAFRETAKSV